MSLSRFPTILWTLLVLSGYLTIATKRIHGGTSNPFDYGIDTKLWALMGISTASLVGSPLLFQSKKFQQPAANSVEKASMLLKEDQKTIQDNNQGRLYANVGPLDAGFTDIFQGDEIGNTAYLDPAKSQMFFFSLICRWQLCISNVCKHSWGSHVSRHVCTFRWHWSRFLGSVTQVI